MRLIKLLLLGLALFSGEANAARTFNASTANYLSNSSAILTAPPLTIACWFKPVAINSTSYIIFDIADSSAGTANHLQMNIRTNNALGAISTASGTQTQASSTANPTAGVWNSGMAVFTSTTSRTIYLNGGNSATDATSNSPTALNWTGIGIGNGNGTVAVPFNGQIAECALWNVALNASEAAAYNQGIRAYMIRPNALVGYWPLNGINSPEPDLSGSVKNMTITGSVAAANGPPTTLFSRHNF